MTDATAAINLSQYADRLPEMDRPTVLHRCGDHSVYWLGNLEETAFRCNAYLLVDGEEALIIDPGNRSFFASAVGRVRQIIDPAKVTGMILCHQDPDVAASMVDWLALNPAITVFSSPRTNVLLPHYGCGEYQFYDVVANPEYTLPSGASLRFVEAPFLHFPGAFATFDSASRFLFSGDIWAALDLNWALVVKDMDDHALQMNLFHVDYMASNVAARGFVARIADLPIRAILPQHGSIIDEGHVPAAIDYLATLQCGIDVIYADLVD